MGSLVYLNGKFLPENKAKVSCLDKGFIYGFGLFETMRSYNGKVFYLDAHINRLRKSCKILGLSVFSKRNLGNYVIKTLETNRLSDAYIRLNLWKADNRINISVVTKKFDMYKPFMYKRGKEAIISNFRVDENSPLAGLKTMNYLNFLLARQAAYKRGADEAILLNTKGEVAEGSRSNIFLVKKKVLYTPLLDSGCIPGIARGIVFRIAKRIKVRVFKQRMRVKDLLNADEAFLTNSLMEIMPLVKVNNILIARGLPGRITEMLLKKYRELTQ